MNRNEISLHETKFRACRMKIRLTETKFRNDPNKGSHYNPSVFASIASEILPCHFARANFISGEISAERNFASVDATFRQDDSEISFDSTKIRGGELSSNFRENKGPNSANFAFITFAQYFRSRLKRQTSAICSTLEGFN